MSDHVEATAPLEYFEVPSPSGRLAEFLRPCEVIIGIKNVSKHAIMLRELRFVFQAAHESVAEKLVTYNYRCEGTALQPGGRHYERVSLTPSLLLSANTNSFRCQVEYSTIVQGRLELPESLRLCSSYLMIREPYAMPGRLGTSATLFISFKDPEDLALARMAATLITRAGFVPYLARDDQRTGIDFWSAKIEPAIEGSEGVLVIWTPESAAKPDSVVRELTYASSVGVPVGLFLQENTRLPKEYSGDRKEYGGPFQRESAFIEFAQEIEACAKQWREEGRPFFG